MTLKSLVNFCIWVIVIAVIASFLLSGFTPKAPEAAHKMVPVNQADRVMELTATAAYGQPQPTAKAVSAPTQPPGRQPAQVPTPRNANIIEQLVMSLLAPPKDNPANPTSGQTTGQADRLPLVSLDDIIASANGKDLNELFDGANPEQKQMIQKYAGGKSSNEMVTNFCRDVHSDSFKQMSQGVKQNSSDPSVDPHSPALLMLLFEKLATLCP